MIEQELYGILDLERKRSGLRPLWQDFLSEEILEGIVRDSGPAIRVEKARLFREFRFFCREPDFEFLVLEKFGLNNNNCFGISQESLPSLANEIFTHNLTLNKSVFVSERFTHIALKFVERGPQILVVLTKKLITVEEIGIMREWINLSGTINDKSIALNEIRIVKRETAFEIAKIQRESIRLEENNAFSASLPLTNSEFFGMYVEFIGLSDLSSKSLILKIPVIEISDHQIQDCQIEPKNSSPRPKFMVQNKLKQKVYEMAGDEDFLQKALRFVNNNNRRETGLASIIEEEPKKKVLGGKPLRNNTNVQKPDVFENFFNKNNNENGVNFSQNFKNQGFMSQNQPNFSNKNSNNVIPNNNTTNNAPYFENIKNPFSNNKTLNNENKPFLDNHNNQIENNSFTFNEYPKTHNQEKILFSSLKSLDQNQIPPLFPKSSSGLNNLFVNPKCNNNENIPISSSPIFQNENNPKPSYPPLQIPQTTEYPNAVQNNQSLPNLYLPYQPAQAQGLIHPQYLQSYSNMPSIANLPLYFHSFPPDACPPHSEKSPQNPKKRRLVVTPSRQTPTESMKKMKQTRSKPLKLVNLAKNPEKPRSYELDSFFFATSDPETQRRKLDEIEQIFLCDRVSSLQVFPELYKSAKFADVFLKLKTLEEFKLHKIVLITNSRYFNELLENANNELVRITLPDFIIKRPLEFLIKYVYLGTFSDEDLKEIDVFLAKEIFILASFFKILKLVEFLGLRILIPRMNCEICLDIFKEANKFLKGKEKIWVLLYRYCLNYIANNAKSLLHNEILQRKLENAGLEADIYLKIVSLSLEKAADVESIEKILTFLAKRGDMGSNIIEILKNTVKNFAEGLKKNDFLNLSASFLEEINGFNEKENFLLDLSPEDRSGMLNISDIMEFADLPSKTNENTGSCSEIIEIFKDVEPHFKGEFPLPLLDPSPHKEPTLFQLFVSQAFYSETRKFRVFFDIQPDRLIFYFQDLGFKKRKFSILHFSSVLVRLSLFKENNYWKDLCFFHSFESRNEKHREVIRKIVCPWTFQERTLAFKLWVIEYPLYSGCLHYLSENFEKIIKEKDPGKRKSLLLCHEHNKLGNYAIFPNNNNFPNGNNKAENQVELYDLGEVEVFFLMRNLREKLTAVFLFNYLKGKSPQSIEYLLKTLQFSQLSLEILLEMAHDHKELKKSAFFQERVISEIFSRVSQGRSAGKEIVDFLVKQEDFSERMREMREKIREKDEENEKLKRENLRIVDEMKKSQRIAEESRIVRPPPINVLNRENLQPQEVEPPITLNFPNCVLF